MDVYPRLTLWKAERENHVDSSCIHMYVARVDPLDRVMVLRALWLAVDVFQVVFWMAMELCKLGLSGFGRLYVLA